MFRENATTWLYLLGILIMFGILTFMFRDFLSPIFLGGQANTIINPVEETPPSFTINTNFDYIAQIQTNLGTITVDLFETNAPQNVNNFVYLAQNDYYAQTFFHRLVPNLLIQGGDRNTIDDNPDNDGKGGPGYVIDTELNLTTLGLSEEAISERLDEGYSIDQSVQSVRMRKYSLAMANDGRDTNGSQFFIIFGQESDNRITYLNGRYTVIGEVINGFDVLDQIANTPVDDPTANNPRPERAIQVIDIATFTR